MNEKNNAAAAIKQLKESGKSLSQHFYNYQQKDENKND